MTLPDKILAVNHVYLELQEETQAFQQQSGLHCLSGCGRCCFKSDIEATALEFLPFAWQVYEAGTAWDWYERLRSTSSSICLILKPTLGADDTGMCSHYAVRGLICRLFGFSARVDKHGVKQLVTCQLIKTDQAEAYQQTSEAIAAGDPVPVMSHYYMKLHAIDPDLSRDFYPINEAIRRALEVVMQYHAYREEN